MRGEQRLQSICNAVVNMVKVSVFRTKWKDQLSTLFAAFLAILDFSGNDRLLAGILLKNALIKGEVNYSFRSFIDAT